MNDPQDQAASTGVEQQYFSRLQQGRFDIQLCGACRQHVFFPREMCPHCGSGTLEWVPAKGSGTVYSTTTISRKPDAGGDYNVSLIDLEEGVRMMSTVTGIDPAAIVIGMPVRSRVVVKDGTAMVIFEGENQ